ncbi:MAG: YidC/Oxa1 family membrane protein insertase [Ruminococcus sp.]|nr:YidC/Oxa1 family membrane protein insertase [Ruminococcus sp.]
MFQIFNVVGSVFGYVLWALFFVFKNFGVSIIFFTLLTRLLMFPTSVKQQKSMAANSRLQAKQRELKEKYGNNKQKYNEEVQKLYAKEGASPFGGCLSSLLPMFIMLGIYYSVVRPLSNVIHIASDKMTDLLNFVNCIPGVNVSSSNIYHEMDILRIFNNPDSFQLLQDRGLSSILSNNDISQIKNLAGGFNLLGLDLLDIPSANGFWSLIIIIPALVLVTSIGSQILTMRMQKGIMNQQQGCMKYMMLGLPLITVYISYIVPGAVGFYWICSTVIGFLQTVVITKFYSPQNLTAKAEAQHVALMELKEAKVPYEYVPSAPQKQENQKNTKKNKKK